MYTLYLTGNDAKEEIKNDSNIFLTHETYVISTLQGHKYNSVFDGKNFVVKFPPEKLELIFLP